MPGMNKIKVNEIFFSLQGEGNRAGARTIFIRLSGCNENCWFCDTDFNYSLEMTPDQILEKIKDYKAEWIVWTGGEPTLQLTTEIVYYFKFLGYKQGIETNGSITPPDGLDWITVSPKRETAEALKKTFKGLKINELKYVFDSPITMPNIKQLPEADFYYISPMFELKDKGITECNIERAVEFVLANEGWRLSVQQHRGWQIK